MSRKGTEKFSWKTRSKSALYALNGMKILFKEEHNSRIHTGITIVVIIAGFLLNISATEWMIIAILVALVFGLEIMNSAVENLCDHVTPEKNEMIRKVKDLAAAAVFFASVISVICGAIIFLPKLCDLF
ncbi:diacylglycerol kinase [Dysgonomonas sp. PFB1-18]|uniref:diacylglycerol kinase family protein n=1 Tax=unclassified Dysgonomonas TaxID=2630389 RepID=UPI0024731CC0|nr:MULTISPECIES: diacylglycerol kinase family protein [unclassified Dysgonomonas]MDH6309292.1 diacylglycerol kinase [Dysgonomonas sp. PF1-14]MDH6339843.1 diacylglycerol kinase [Dysgonomonas sp. PF1-16]MDH6381491.1 diacylglycerol kinase [Dysgonomonas sp. PFB1-18]MDH6398706.1 diacylglycerol kinase [Dysgonomonas sp. PF1-23]